MADSIEALPARNSLHLMRKFWHIGGGSLAITLFFISGVSVSLLRQLCFCVLLFSVFVEVLRMNSKRVNVIFVGFWKPFMRESEVKGFTGTSFYLLGVWLSLSLFKFEIALLSILFLVVADPVSSLIGNLYGSRDYLPNKSIEGSLGCFITCYFLCFIYLKNFHGQTSDIHFLFAFLAGLIGTVSETVSAFKIDDNLTIPLVSGAGLSLLNMFIKAF